MPERMIKISTSGSIMQLVSGRWKLEEYGVCDKQRPAPNGRIGIM
jgi:hypothetical protein